MKRGATSRPRGGRGSAARAGRGTRGTRGTRGSVPAPALPQYLRRLGVTPRKALGQHFLVDELLLSEIAEACLLEPGDTVLEVGAGPGGLTEELLPRATRVVAVEIDEELAALTRARLGTRPGSAAGPPGHGELCVVAADVLAFTPSELLAECGVTDPEAPYVATGNLPFFITQPVLRRLLEADPAPRRVVVLVQREVAHRIVGGPGHESFLSLRTKCFGSPELVLDVPSSAFWPEPRVQAALLRVERLATPAVALPVVELPRFFKLLRAGFSEPRKQLHNSLRHALGLSPAETQALLSATAIDPASRAQHLQLRDWERLYGAVAREHAEALDAG